MIKKSPGYSPNGVIAGNQSPNYSPAIHNGMPSGHCIKSSGTGAISGNNSPAYSQNIKTANVAGGIYSQNSPAYSPHLNQPTSVMIPTSSAHEGPSQSGYNPGKQSYSPQYSPKGNIYAQSPTYGVTPGMLPMGASSTSQPGMVGTSGKVPGHQLAYSPSSPFH